MLHCYWLICIFFRLIYSIINGYKDIYSHQWYNSHPSKWIQMEETFLKWNVQLIFIQKTTNISEFTDKLLFILGNGKKLLYLNWNLRFFFLFFWFHFTTIKTRTISLWVFLSYSIPLNLWLQLNLEYFIRKIHFQKSIINNWKSI